MLLDHPRLAQVLLPLLVLFQLVILELKREVQIRFTDVHEGLLRLGRLLVHVEDQVLLPLILVHCLMPSYHRVALVLREAREIGSHHIL